MWFLISIIGYILLALVLLLDKVYLEDHVSKPVIYTFLSTVYMLILSVFLFFVPAPSFIDILLSLLAGAGFGFGLWFMFLGVRYESANRLNPFIGAFTTICILVLSTLFLHETLSSFQMLGIGILVITGIVLSLLKGKHFRGLSKYFFIAFLSALCFAISHVLSKYLYTQYDFVSILLWTRTGIGLVAFVTLLSPDVRKFLWKSKKQKEELEKKSSKISKKPSFGIFIINKVAAVVAVLLLQYATSIGSVTIVNALSGIQFPLLFVLTILCTKFFHKFFQETLSRKEIFQELGVLGFVVIGSALVVF